MSLAYYALIVSIVSTSILDIVGVTFGAWVEMTAGAVCLLAASIGAKSADRDQFLRATSGVRWILIAIPFLILVQLLPVWLSLAHPIWTSAHDALGGLSWGYVTADFGLTLNALFLTISGISLLGVTIVITRNRGRAEFILFVLSGLTTLAALIFDLHRLMPTVANSLPSDLAATFGGLGLMLNFAIMQLAAERAETHHALSRSIAIGLCGLAGALITALAIGFSSANNAVAAAIGVALFLLILLIRRLDLSTLAAVALTAAALIGAGIVLAFVFEKSSGSLLLRLVPDIASETKVALERMFSDTRWLGAGAGGFTAVARIYQRDAGELLAAPSAAAAIFVNTGWIGLAAVTIGAVALVVRLFLGSLARGRDSFFAAAAAACLCFGLVQAFIGTGLLRPAALLALSAIVGLGLSQSVGQASRS